VEYATFIIEGAETSNQGVSGNCGSVNFDTKYVCNDLFGLFVKFWVDQGYMVVTGYTIPLGGKSIINFFDSDCIW